MEGSTGSCLVLMGLAWQSLVIAFGQVLKSDRQDFGLKLDFSPISYLQMAAAIQLQIMFPGKMPMLPDL